MAAPSTAKGLQEYLKAANDADQQGSPQARKVAYFLRLFVCERGMECMSAPGADTAALEQLIGGILGTLETSKQQLSIDSSQQVQDIEQIKTMAISTFAGAHKVDKTGAATKQTAIEYRLASQLGDVVRHFVKPNIDQKLEDLSKYAKLRTVSIVKDLVAGKQPLPPGGPELGDIDAQLAALADVGPGAHTQPGQGDVTMGGADYSLAQAAGFGGAAALPTSAPGSAPGWPQQGAQGYPPQQQQSSGMGMGMGGMGMPAPQHGASMVGLPPLKSPQADLYASQLGHAGSGVHAGQGGGPMHAMPSAGQGQGFGQGMMDMMMGRTGSGGSQPAFGGYSPKVGSSNDVIFKDAAELTRFALKAIHERNAERAAQFLQQALGVVNATAATGTMR